MEPFLPLPNRTQKPRETGLTHVIDTGLAPRQAEDLIQVAGPHIDILKLGWGTAYVTGGLERKLAVYREAGIPVVLGGTFIEVALHRGRLAEFIQTVERLGLTHIEVSDGTIDLSREDKLALIQQLERSFVVLSEVGFKDSAREVDAVEWGQWAREELDAGAWKVVTEARESGTVGLFDSTGAVRQDVIDQLAASVDIADLIFEAPQKSQQTWFVKALGSNVNLGNIAPADVIGLETLRLGLRGDTLLNVEVENQAPLVAGVGDAS